MTATRATNGDRRLQSTTQKGFADTANAGVDVAHARVDFFSVLSDALARCEPAFSEAIPALVPNLDSQNSSLAESMTRGFEYLEQLARIGSGEANEKAVSS